MSEKLGTGVQQPAQESDIERPATDEEVNELVQDFKDLIQGADSIQSILGGKITKNKQSEEVFPQEQFFAQVDQKIPELISLMQAYIDADDRTLQKKADEKIREIYAILEPLDEIQTELPEEMQNMLSPLKKGIRNGVDYRSWGHSRENAQKAIESLHAYLKMREE